MTIGRTDESPSFPFVEFRRNTSKIFLRKFEKSIDIYSVMWYNMYVIKRGYNIKQTEKEGNKTMSHYTKERNIIIIDIDGVNGQYRFDIATGVFYGLRGAPVKTCQKKSAVANLFGGYQRRRSGEQTQLDVMLYEMFDYAQSTSHYIRFLNALATAEKLDNMGLPNKSWGKGQLEVIGENFKIFTKWVKTLDEETRTSGNYRYGDFDNYLKAEKVKSRWSEAVINLFPQNILVTLLGYDTANFTDDDMALCAYYLVRGKMYEYTGGSIGRLIEYINMCKAMKQAPRKENNFMREYCETRKTYELKKQEYDDEQLRNNYAKHAKAFEFAYGDFVVVLPKCGQDIVAEGQNMHHCVGGYVDRVVRNETYIIFVRHKDTPDKCYLTCQVHTSGEIGQYYLAYDNCISSAEDRAFKEALAEHLAKYWND